MRPRCWATSAPLDSAVGSWIAARDAEEVLREFEQAQAAISLVYDASDVVKDPQYQALCTFLDLPDEELGEVTVQNVQFRLSETPGKVRWPGPALGRHTDEVLGELGYDTGRIEALRADGVVA
ncbi:CoA transferase [Saccharopolyspora hattusasensis]|uniref:CoA transferase n=1 Tax=Saccharopolyspora hattusasensis TaxID=1128679 RepID=UPI003D99ACC1